MTRKHYVVFLEGGADFRVRAYGYAFEGDLLVFKAEDGSPLDDELRIQKAAVQAIVPDPLGQRASQKGFRPPGAD